MLGCAAGPFGQIHALGGFHHSLALLGLHAGPRNTGLHHALAARFVAFTGNLLGSSLASRYSITRTSRPSTSHTSISLSTRCRRVLRC